MKQKIIIPTPSQMCDIIMYIKNNIKFYTEEEQLKQVKEQINQATTIKEIKIKPEKYNVIELLEGIENDVNIMLSSSQINKIISLIQFESEI